MEPAITVAAPADPRYEGALRNFASALESFQRSLSDGDRKAFENCSSADAMVQAIKDCADGRPEKSRLLRSCKRVDEFSKKLEPFFAVIGIFVDTHPEYAGFAWGAVRLVFLLCSHYAGYFEKLAEMFERLGQKLPRYSRHYDLWKRRSTLFNFQSRNEKLLQNLALVYTDILFFCQEACKIFSAKHRGVRHTVGIIRDLFWKPFDLRFADILARLAKHEELYELELNLAEKEEMLQHYQWFQEELAQAQSFREICTQQIASEEAAQLTKRLGELKTWIQAPEYMAAFERERSRIDESSGSWLFSQDTYKAWESGLDGSADECLTSKVLIIQGSPGYGKTALSATVIDHLGSLSRATTIPSCIAFFHFDNMDPHLRHADHAFRAILNQILHRHRKNRDLIDSASLLMDSEGTGQSVGSHGDIASVLRISLERNPFTILVVDGVDECTDPTAFLLQLHGICANAKCWLIIFSRPDISIPHPLHRQYRIHLSRGANIADIELYVHSKLREFLENGYIPPNTDIGFFVGQISKRSESLFLWVKLLMDYLASPSLTPRERMEAMRHLNLLEGLEALFGRILQNLDRKYRNEKRVVLTTFRWLSASVRPLKASELQVALAIRINQASDPELDYLVDFEPSIVQICGALIEVRDDGIVQFIHLCVKEFLTTQDMSLNDPNPGGFYVHVPTAHINIATHCLSYLSYDIPRTPLSGAKNVKPDKTHLQVQYPLLMYALNAWDHAVKGVSLEMNEITASYVAACTGFGILAERFLVSKTAVTLWIEAIWTFSIDPPLKLLVQKLDYWQGVLSIAPLDAMNAFTQLFKLRTDLADLTKDLGCLQNDWQHVLHDRPCEIWEPSINAFLRSRFLSAAQNAHIFWTNSSSENEPQSTMHATKLEEAEFTLMSQVSADGATLAILSLQPSPFYHEVKDCLFYLELDSDEEDSDEELDWEPPPSTMEAAVDLTELVSPGWKIKYQVRPTDVNLLHSRKGFADITLELPSKDVFQMILMSFFDTEPGEFRIPVSLSPDLKTATVLHSIMRFSTSKGWLHMPDEVLVDQANQMMRRSPPGIQTGGFDLSQKVWQYTVFSPSSTFLAVVRSGHQSGVDGNEFYDCFVTVYKDSSPTDDMPSYKAISDIGPIEFLGGVSNPLCFHTSFPVIVLVASGRTYLWRFEEFPTMDSVQANRDQSMVMIYHRPLEDVTISPPGHVLLGKQRISTVVAKSCLTDASLKHPTTSDEVCRDEMSDFGIWNRINTSALGLFYEDDHIDDGETESSSESDEWSDSEGSLKPSSGEQDAGEEADVACEPDSIMTVETAQEAADGEDSTSTEQRRSRRYQVIDDDLMLIDLTKELPDAKDDTETVNRPRPSVTDDQQPAIGNDLALCSMPDQTPMLSSGSIIPSRREAVLRTSSVRQYDNYGAVTLESTDSTGLLRTADLLRIPRSVVEEGSKPVLLQPQNSSPNITIVLNKVPQVTYNFDDESSGSLPLLAERRRDTILTYTHQRYIEFDDRKRLDSPPTE